MTKFHACDSGSYSRDLRTINTYNIPNGYERELLCLRNRGNLKHIHYTPKIARDVLSLFPWEARGNGI